jgi:hypothetical protein
MNSLIICMKWSRGGSFDQSDLEFCFMFTDFSYKVLGKDLFNDAHPFSNVYGHHTFSSNPSVQQNCASNLA